MTKYNQYQNSISNGELSPKLRGRFDLAEYNKGVELLERFIPYKSGGVGKCPGAEYVKNLSITNPATLISFTNSSNSSYVIIIAPGETNPVKVYDVTNRTLSNIGFQVTAPYLIAEADFTSSIDYTGFQYAQDGDSLFVVHNSSTFAPFEIRYESGTFALYHMFNDQLFTTSQYWQMVPKLAWRDANIDTALTLTPSATGGTGGVKNTAGTAVTITASTGYFDATCVGSFIRITHSGKEGVAYIDTYSSTTVVTGTICVNFNGTTASDDWMFNSHNPFHGWPRSIAFYQQRRIFGGNTSEPQKFWASAIGRTYEYMAGPLDQDISSDASGLGFFGSVDDTNAFNYRIASTEANHIKWMVSGDVLVMGSSGRLNIALPLNGIFSKNNIDIRTPSGMGTRAVQPFMTNDAVLFATKDGKRVRHFGYYIENGKTIDRDLTTLSSDIIFYNGGKPLTASDGYSDIKIQQITWQESRSTAWIVNSNLKLIGLTYEPNSGIIGFHKHPIGASDATAYTDVISVATVENQEQTFDDLYIIARREINGADTYYLERIGEDFEHDILNPDFPDLSDITNHLVDIPIYLDSAVAVSTELSKAFLDGVGSTVSIRNATYKWTASGFGTDTFYLELAAGGDPALLQPSSLDENGTRMTEGDMDGAGFSAGEWGWGDKDSLGFDTVYVRLTATGDPDSQAADFVSAEYGNSINLWSNTIAISDVNDLTYTGLGVVYNEGTTSPPELVDVTTYYVIRVSSGIIKLATTEANAIAGTAIDLSDYGSGTHTFTVADGTTRTKFPCHHLIGETNVTALRDGVVEEDLTVASDGTVTLSTASEQVVLGLPYNATIRTMPLEAGGQYGVSMGNISRIDRLYIQFYKTFSAKFGYDVNALESVPFTGDSTTGNFKMDVPIPYDEEQSIYIRSDQPHPCSVLGIGFRGVSYDG